MVSIYRECGNDFERRKPMTRTEYIQRVELELGGFNEADKREAIEYLNEYFDEAGVDKEQEVIAELGPADKYARIIKADLIAETKPLEEIPEIRKNTYSNPPERIQDKQSPWKTIGIVLLGICALPVALPLAFAAIMVILAIFIVLIALVFSLAMVFLCCVLAIFLFGFRLITTLGQVDFGISLFFIGVILLSAGLIILSVLGIRWLIKKGIPDFSRWCSRIYKKLRKKEN